MANKLHSFITDNVYSDPNYNTLAIDFGFYIANYYDEKDKSWYPSDYSPNITSDEWLELLNDSSIFTTNSLQIMKRLKDYGGVATCTQLAKKYGEVKNFYNVGSSSLAKRIIEKTGCKVFVEDTGNDKYWPVLYIGQPASEDDDGSYKWKIRDELSEALDQFDLSNVELYAKSSKETGQYWWLNANPKVWTFSNISIGEEISYTLYNDNGNKRRIFQNFLEAKVGDRVIGYESNPSKKIVCLLEVSQASDGTKIVFKKTEELINPIGYSDLHALEELKNMEFFINGNGTFFKLNNDEYELLMDIIRDENPKVESKTFENYTKEDFLDEVFMNKEQYDSLVALLKDKKNIVLQGAPGVGKTFCAKRLAYSIMGCVDKNRVSFVQFHQNYTYEDFVKGYKPNEDGFELKDGIFYSFCKKASNNPDQDYFFIIDEINRGNLSKIFGELLMMIEKDYRDVSVDLAYDGLPFTVPKNVYIIGMMNTADRSLAMIDYALRRRFSFVKMEPAFYSEGFKKYQESLNDPIFNDLINTIIKLNNSIKEDNSLGEGFCLGHSYFCGKTKSSPEWLERVIDYDIIPTLEEYWFDDNEKINQWSNQLHGVLNGEG